MCGATTDLLADVLSSCADIHKCPGLLFPLQANNCYVAVVGPILIDMMTAITMMEMVMFKVHLVVESIDVANAKVMSKVIIKHGVNQRDCGDSSSDDCSGGMAVVKLSSALGVWTPPLIN